MRNVLIGIACAVVLVIGRFALHAYYVHQAEDDAMDAYVDARLSQPFSMPLDCPPLAQQKVTFLTDQSTSELTKENGPAIQMHWNELWPAVYQGIQKEMSDWKDEEKAKLSEKVEIQVDLPSKAIETNPTWQVEVDCAAGHFTTEINGYTVGQTQIN